MPLLSSLERRGAVYYWRRRPPSEIACRIGRSHLKISLRTMDSRTARFRAVQLSALAETLFAMPIPSILTSAQAHDLFKTAFTQHLTKLMALNEIDRSDGRRLDEIADIERVQGQAYRLLSQFGGNGGDLTDTRERESLASRGLSDAESDRVLSQLAVLRQASRSAQSTGKIERLLAGVGAEINARNVSASRTYYYRALGEALLRSANDTGDDLPYEELVEEAVSQLIANASRPPMGAMEVRPSGPTVASASLTEQSAATVATLPKTQLTVQKALQKSPVTPAFQTPNRHGTPSTAIRRFSDAPPQFDGAARIIGRDAHDQLRCEGLGYRPARRP